MATYLSARLAAKKGDTGVKGDTGLGDTGIRGEVGDTGVRGDTGPQGTKGDTGLGDTGIPGYYIVESISASQAAVANHKYMCDTTAAGFTLTLPATPAAGDAFIIVDALSQFETNPLILAGNGKNIESIAEDMNIDVQGVECLIQFSGDNTRGWMVNIGDKTVPIILDSYAPDMITFTILGPGGGEITPGVKGFIVVPYKGMITGYTMLADKVGSITIDIMKQIYEHYEDMLTDPLGASMITNNLPAGEYPTITNAQKAQTSSLSNWSPDLQPGYILGFNVISCTDITKLMLSLTVRRG